jgi:hypothetical protein
MRVSEERNPPIQYMVPPLQDKFPVILKDSACPRYHEGPLYEIGTLSFFNCLL